MKIVLLLCLILIACTQVDEVTFNKSWLYDEECWYDKEGDITNSPCQPLSVATWGAEFHKSALLPRHNPDDYFIEMVGFHTESEAREACSVMTGVYTNACIAINRTEFSAVVFTVYGDEESKRHEFTHIENDY